MGRKYEEAFKKAEGYADLFEVVKSAVNDFLGLHRAGLMLGLCDLGYSSAGFVGGYFAVGSNIIVMNKVPISLIKEKKNELYKPYIFYVLLHEYLHALGVLSEEKTRALSYQICEEAFGEEMIITKISKDFSKYFGNLMNMDLGSIPPDNSTIELVSDFDRSSVTYIG
ncbi:MAG: hypothetical protein SVJ22_07350 [Halobacteriota archaeon]|nr:hypothetical protein [Halobacteriota archaeon]